MVLVGVGLPLLIHDLRHILRLNQVKHKSVAVVVMTGILVIQPRRRRAFVLCAEVFVVPVGHHNLAIRVEARHHQRDDVIQNTRRFLIGPGDLIVS